MLLLLTYLQSSKRGVDITAKVIALESSFMFVGVVLKLVKIRIT